MEEAVTFLNKNGKKLFGIMHIPENLSGRDRRIGVTLLTPGIKYRVAPHRMNVKLARELCRQGYYVMRFDPEGIGDSEGDLPDGQSVVAIWGKIQTGLFVSDTIVANDFFLKKYKIDELILMGNCGGAITSLLASAADPRVDALCLIDVPVYLLTANFSFADIAFDGGEKADWFFSEYIKKVFRLNAWYRFITMKTDYKALWKTLANKLFKGMSLPSQASALPGNLDALCSEKNLNKLFFESFGTFFTKKKPTLFAVAELDHGTEIFQNYFINGYLKECRNNGSDLVEIFMIEKANHVYTLVEWQEALINKIVSWVQRINLEN